MWRVALTLCLAACGRWHFDPGAADDTAGDAGADGAAEGGDGAGSSAVVWRGTTVANEPMSASTTISLTVPTDCAANDMLIAAVAMGSTGNSQPITLAAPAGWTPIRDISAANDTTSGMYWHVLDASDSSIQTWTTNGTFGGVAWMSCYAGIDRVSPVDAEAGVVRNTLTTTYASPTITTLSANAVVVVTFMVHGPLAPWTPPAMTTVRADVTNGSTRAGLGVETVQATPGASPAFTAVSGMAQDYALVHVVALKPAT